MTTSVVAREYGGPEVLAVLTEEPRVPGPGQVLVRTRAIGVNPADLKAVTGVFGTDPARLPLRLGAEAAGVVAEVGPGVSEVTPGAEVIVHPAAGAYTTDLVADVASLTPRPPSVSWEQAAGLLLTGVTAWHALAVADLRPGLPVLVHGAGGGVGQALLQLARLRGVDVVATGSAASHARLAALGATPVAYGAGLLDRVRAAAPGGYAAAFDLVGTDEAIDVSLALVPPSAVVSIAGHRRAGDGITLLGAGPGSDPGTSVRAAARAPLAGLAGSGRLTVRVDRTFPLTAAAAALAYLREGHARGKVVLVP